MYQESTYPSGAECASPEPLTTEYGAGVLEGVENDIREIDKGDAEHWTRLFGRILRLRRYANGGSVSWADAEDMLYAVSDELGLRTRLELACDIRNAIRKVGDEAIVASGESPPAELGSLPPREPEAPDYADRVAVDALWERAVPCVMDDDAYHWLQLRGIEPREVEFQRLARFLPRDAITRMTPEQIEAVKTVLPMTKIRGEFGVATRLGFRIVLPMFDAEGDMRSLRLRRTNLGKDKHGNARLRKGKKSEPKELGIKGAARGLVLANGPALELLRGRGQRPDSWGDRELCVVIAEGVPDFLVASCEPDEAVRAVFGITGPGCWSLDIAARVPFDARVEIATDSDPAGISYAKQVALTLAGRRTLSRWRPWSVGKNGRSKHDLSDVFGLRGGVSHAVR